MLKGKIYKTVKDTFTALTNVQRSILDKHAPFKTKIIKGNQAPFITKSLSRAIMTRSRLRSKYNKWLSRGNFLTFRKVFKNCVTVLVVNALV